MLSVAEVRRLLIEVGTTASQGMNSEVYFLESHRLPGTASILRTAVLPSCDMAPTRAPDPRPNGTAAPMMGAQRVQLGATV